MPVIIVGYGDYAEYRLGELPVEILEELAGRYALTFPVEYSPEYDDLAITVALHAEINRRKSGGQQAHHTPSRRALAQILVGKGFQQTSKHHHPDGDGNHEAQVRLGQVRDELLEACENISNDRPENVIIIPPPPPPRPARRPPSRPATANDIFDDDVPF